MTTTTKQIKLLLVEDSDVQREVLINILSSCKDIQIVGLAKNGAEAIEVLKIIKPDIVLMDIHMPKMNGVEAITHIMSTDPLPIIAMSATSSMDEITNGFHALKAGAIAFSEKPINSHDPQYIFLCNYLIQTVKLMSEIKVVRRLEKYTKPSKMTTLPPKNMTIPFEKDIQLIAIGVSTGGPLVMQSILSLLPVDFPPILIVQHIAPGFIQGLIQWLTETTHCLIQLANDNDLPQRGHVYLAPDHYEMGLGNNGHIFLKPNNSNHEICPSVDFLFESVANVVGDKAIGILLTGMGSDGAKQLKKMRERGAITIAQTKETSLIYGMPGQAIALNAATYILTPEEIATMIASLSRGAI